MLSPYPPGVPLLLPGEVVTRPALDDLLDGPGAGMIVPDADPTLSTLRVVANP